MDEDVTSRENAVYIADVIIDCLDPEGVAAFWSQLLGRRIAGRKGQYVWLERSEGQPGFGCQQTTEPPLGKNRVHVDLAVSDLQLATRRIETLGGQGLDGYASGGFLVMADPEGNEFCVIPQEPFALDDDGREDYLHGVDV